MKQMGLVRSGDALEQGIGAMRIDRVKSFYRKIVGSGLLKSGEIYPADAVTLRFVNHRIGLQIPQTNDD